MKPQTSSRLFSSTASLLLALSVGVCSPVFFAGCGGAQIESPDDLDESETAGIGIADTLPIGGKAEVYNTGGVGVNLRTGPGTGYSVLLTIPEGGVVDVLAGPSSSFYKLRYAGKEGWSHMSYLRPSSGGGGGGAYPSGIKWDAANSGNYMAGRDGSSIKRVVIHDMEGYYAGAISWFKNPASNVSAHYCIRSSDGDITQMVREQDTAYHAGNWTYNKESVGIEHEGFLSAPSRWYTDVMYRRSAQLTAAITKRYGVAVDRKYIIGHAEVPPPNTHTDPGPGWDWNKYIGYIKAAR
jgi:hypothetical protein